MSTDLLEKLVDKSLTTEALCKRVKKNFDLLPEIIEGMNSPKAAIRYGGGKIAMELSEKYPEKIYPYMDFFIQLLDSNYRILTWQAMVIIANLTRVDSSKKFDSNFNKYYHFIHDEYMVTVANIVGHSGKIACAKPYLIPQITRELLKVQTLTTTPHLTEECKRVIAEKAIDSFDMFFDKVELKDEVLAFIKKYTVSSRRTLKIKAKEFLNKWGN